MRINRKFRLKAILFVFVVLLTLVLSGCGSESKSLLSISIETDMTTAEVGDIITITLKSSPDKPTFDHEGKQYNAGCIEYYARINGVDNRFYPVNNVISYEVKYSEDIVFWAKYCSHSLHKDTENDIVSNSVSVKVNYSMISTVEELQNINGTRKGYKLANDIDLGGMIWKPISLPGALNGQGYTISNFVLNDINENLGFFSVLNGSISNTNFTNVVVNARSSKSNMGIIAGLNKGSIDSCTVEGKIDIPTGKNIGGIAGSSDTNSTIKGCVNKASVTGGDFTGGIAGVSKGKISSCSNTGEIKGTSYVGGIAGDVSAASVNNENKGNVTATGNNVGGVFGNSSSTTGTLSNYGDVSSLGDYVGGIIGKNNGEISEFVNAGSVSGKYYVGGYFGYNKTAITGAINNSTITGRAYVGGIAGQNDGVLVSCENHGEIISTGTITDGSVLRSYLGGLAGQCGGVDYGVNDVNITGTGTQVGGLAGYVKGDITNSTNEGSVIGAFFTGGLGGYVTGKIAFSTNNGTVTGENSVGGLAGRIEGDKIEYCTNTASIIGEESSIGGLVGYSLNSIEITFSENLANVQGAGSFVGGYVGYSNGTSKIIGGINNNDITGKAYVGGILGTGVNTSLIDCENNGVIKTTGTVVEDSVVYSYVGGLAGACKSIMNGKNYINIIGEGDRVGGLAGYINTDVTDSQNDADVNGKKQTGGLAGYISGSILSSKNTGLVTGLSNTGGLAGYFKGSKIENSSNEGIVTGSHRTGGLVGGAYSTYEINESSNTVNVTGENFTAAYVGYSSSSSTIRNAINNSVITGKVYVGGIVGYGPTTTLTNCENYGEINCTSTVAENNSIYSYVGGLAGYCYAITKGINTVNINGLGDCVGGLAGYAGSTISKSQNEGSVNGKNRVGGLAGTVLGNITESDNFGKVIGYDYTGGIVGYFSGGKLDIISNSGIVEGNDYTGGLIGSCDSTLELKASENQADVFGGYYTGGYIGRAFSSANIREAVNTNRIEGKAYVGGILGSGDKASMFYCENDGTVIASSYTIVNNMNSTYIGGLAGNCALIENGKNTKDVTGVAAYVGGLAGYVSGAIYKSNNEGDINGEHYTGGFAGYIGGNITESTNLGNIVGKNYTGGFAGKIALSKIGSSTNSGLVSGEDYVGSFAGYSANTLEIAFSDNSANIYGTGNRVGSLIGEANSTTIRSTKNTGTTNDKYKCFIAFYNGTLKGLPYICDLTTYSISTSDTITSDFLGISAHDFSTKKSLAVSFEIVEGTQTAGSTMLISVIAVDEYENQDVRYFEIKVYEGPSIVQTATTISINDNPLTDIGRTIHFDMNGADGSAPDPQIISSSIGLQYPIIPNRDGHIFAGWYTTSECEGEPYDFTKTIEKDMVLYAKWISVETSILNLNESYSEYFASSSEKTYAFVPLASCTITIRTSRNSGDVDGYLQNSSKSELISDKATSANVYITYSVTAGELYYIRIKSHSGSGNVPIFISCDEAADGAFAMPNLNAKKALNITAKDNFGLDLDVSVILKSGIFEIGNYVVYTICAVDAAGNVCTIDTNPILVTE